MENITIENLNNEQNPIKRTWVTPDIEVISTDDIQGGPINFLAESSTPIGALGS